LLVIDKISSNLCLFFNWVQQQVTNLSFDVTLVKTVKINSAEKKL